uniref:HAUS augmin like complex subunit 5 n=1 Tax=Latimeria chalumnae TaxID=7897 RepID=M3XKL8_LATCH|nr:PREDICTED: HAUS augmin-like complex subunit 5 [Latimeria chalumnae]|eukprot:XP_005999221.1 PREDICTED: HAUS augmin-like complex subunit 5 [Latimeria chalumnae]
MGLPARKLPPDSMFRKLCLGQCADIWKHVTQHVCSQRTVKKIRGNLYWYTQLQQSEVEQKRSENELERRRQLLQDISGVTSEIQQLDLQIEMAQRQLASDESAIEQTQEKIRDVKKRILLLRAYSNWRAKERKKLRENIVKINHSLERCQHVSSQARSEVVLGSIFVESNGSGNSSSAVPESEVLRDVKKACIMRYEFIRSLLYDETLGSLLGSEEQKKASYQLWLSLVEKIASSHPPNHILQTLEHLAAQNAHELHDLTDSLSIPKDLEKLKFRVESSHLQDVSAASAGQPSVQWLLQEGWGNCEKLWVQQLPLQALQKKLSAVLASVLQETYPLLSDGAGSANPSRAALELELKAVKAMAYRDALLEQCQELGEAAALKQQEVRELQQKLRCILDFRELVVEKQDQIRALVKGNSCSKSQLKKSRAEIESFIREKLLRHEASVESESSKLRNAVSREVKQFSLVALPCLQLRTFGDVQRVPAHKLSIRKLTGGSQNETRVLRNAGQSLAFPFYKAPERLAYHVAEIKLELRYLQVQLSCRNSTLQGAEQHKPSSAPDVRALLQLLREHDQEQVERLLPRIQRLMQLNTQGLKYEKEVRGTISAWWEQPAQFSLPGEKRLGLTLQQWLERWVLGVKTLQQKHWS